MRVAIETCKHVQQLQAAPTGPLGFLLGGKNFPRSRRQEPQGLQNGNIPAMSKAKEHSR
jgi:hypothetical protein